MRNHGLGPRRIKVCTLQLTECIQVFKCQLVLDGRSVPIDVGRSKRLATVHQRRALEAIYLHCAIPDCEVIFDHCNIHHIEYWENGGPTDLNNMVPLCSQHHHAAHEGGWKLTLNPKTRKLTIDS